MNRKIKIKDVARLNKESYKRSELPPVLKYLDTGSLTKNKISKIQYFDKLNDKIPSRAQRKIKKDTILYSTVRPNQEHYGFLERSDLVVSTGFTTVDIIDKNIFPKYVYFLLTQKRVTDYLHTIGIGSVSSYPSISPGDLGDLEFVIPTFETQKCTASFLSSIDKKIELNNKINTELEAMAKLIYDYWFVQFDFPDENGKPYKSSGGKMVWYEKLKREIPEGWKAGVLADLFFFNPSMPIKKGAVASYIDMDALPIKGFMTKSIQTKKFNGGIKFQNGDVVIARITPCLENGKTGLISLLADGEIGFGSTEFISIRGKELSLSGFASCLSRSELFRKYAIRNMTGTSGRKRVDAASISLLPIAIPSNPLLKKFENNIESAFTKMTLNTKENQHLSDLRDWLLPMLMNGQVKVR